MEFKGIEERVRDSVGSEILKRHMQAASEKRNKGADITKRALSGGLPAPTTTERPTQALGGQPLNAFGQQMLGEGITRNALKDSSSQIKDFIEGTPPPSQSNSSQVPTFNKDQFKKDIVNNSMKKNLRERGSILAPGGQITPKSDTGSDTRNVEIENANGVVQKGTQTSPKPMTMDDANKLLTGGYTMNQQYAGSQLPTTASSPYAGKSNAQIYNPDTLNQFDSDVDYVSLSKNLDEDKSGVATYERGKNMNENYKQMDVNPGESVPEEKVNWANRTMADNSDSKLARRRAFLDAKGSMQGLRRSEAVQNITYAGGKHYIGDGKGGDKLVEMGNKQDVRKYKSGEEGAREMRDKYVNALTSKGDSPAPLPDSEQQASNVEASSNQKPLTVAPNDIPSDLSGEAGEAYLRKLDAGQLTRKR